MTLLGVEPSSGDATEAGLQDSELLVRLFLLALKAADEPRIAAILPRIVELLPKLNDQNLARLLAPSVREDTTELAVQAVHEIATRDTISLALAVAILRIAHVSEDRNLGDRIESTLLQRLPVGQHDLFRMRASSMRAGPQSALKVARRNKKPERTPSEAVELGMMLMAAGESWLALRYMRRCAKKWPNNTQCSVLLIRTYLITGQAETALALLDAADHLQASPKLDPLRLHILLDLGASEQALEEVLAQDMAAPDLKTLKQLSRLHMALGNMAEAERLIRIMTTSTAGTRKSVQHFQTSHLGQLLNEWKILEKVRTDLAMTSSSRDLAAVYFYEAKRVLNEVAGDLAKPPHSKSLQAIPRQIWQYWNTPEMPDEIELAIDSWRGQAGWKHHRLSHSDALAWLRDTFDEEHARAFRLARHIAQGADFLRLCLLLAEGGVYADADDKRTGCLEALAAESPGILLFRDPQGAVCNNFICATPGHPIMVRAVDMARNSLLHRENDSTWSKTGPGLLTRATALHVIDNPEAAKQDTRVLRQNLSRRFVHPHLAIAYKSTPSYWNAESDGTATRMQAALLHLVSAKADDPVVVDANESKLGSEAKIAIARQSPPRAFESNLHSRRK